MEKILLTNHSRRRGRSSRFGDRLCMEKHRGFLHLLSLKNAFRARLPPKLHRQLIHKHHLQPHLQCGNDPTVANHNGILSTTHARKTVETPFTMRNGSETDPRPIRDRSETNPRMIRPHTRPSRTRRTAEVDHRGSGTDFVWKNIGVSCICYLSKTHFVRDFLQNSIGNSSTSTTCQPIYNAGTSYSCKSQWNSVDHTCTKNSWNPIYNAEPIRDRSETNPRMIRPHTRPSRTRRTAEVDHRGSGTDFVWKNIGVSCICYLSKTHFVRDFLQNSIGNSSGSTTCNPICIAGTINALTNSCFNYPFPWPTFDELFLRRTLSLTNCFFD